MNNKNKLNQLLQFLSSPSLWNVVYITSALLRSVLIAFIIVIAVIGLNSIDVGVGSITPNSYLRFLTDNWIRVVISIGVSASFTAVQYAIAESVSSKRHPKYTRLQTIVSALAFIGDTLFMDAPGLLSARLGIDPLRIDWNVVRSLSAGEIAVTLVLLLLCAANEHLTAFLLKFLRFQSSYEAAKNTRQQTYQQRSRVARTSPYSVNSTLTGQRSNL